MTQTHHQLDNGIELVLLQLPNRHAAAMEIRVIAGSVNESEEKLGLARLTQQTLDKGTSNYSGKELSDAFDEIGCGRSSWSGREITCYSSLCLPEFLTRNIELHAEFIRNPVFPDESCQVAIQLAKQELLALEDDAHGLADKLLCRQAFGPILGRHSSGENETLDRISRDDFVSFWKNNYCTGRMQVSVAGPVDDSSIIEALEKAFAGFKPTERTHRSSSAVEFTARKSHRQKDTEQEQIALAIPGVAVNHQDYATEQVLLGILSGGMSARLFTEIREKQGLVYWVGAWHDNPRGSGMLFAGASTTPERCDKTYETLIRELKRVGQDVTQEELDRARAGIEVRAGIRSDITKARCSEQADDLLHYFRPVPWEEKFARIRAVTVRDIERYCEQYINDSEFSVVTLGPRPLDHTA